ncbi:MAG: MFS transporter [Acidimicrobiia bacterium]
MTAQPRLGRTFLVVWSGQLVSLVGSSLTGFALAVWVFQQTGSATRLALVLLATTVPGIILGPFAGALVDRWDRRWAMILSDTGAAIGTLIIAVLHFTDNLEIWHLYPALALSAAFATFQFPAYSAATSLLVPKDQYGRAAGMVQIAEAVGQIVGPMLGGLLLFWGELTLVLIVDVATFLFAVLTLTWVRFPAPEKSVAGQKGEGRLWHEARYGLTYVRERKPLWALMMFFTSINFVFGFVSVLLLPLMLSFASEAAVGFAFGLAAVGMLVGSVVVSTWGGPRRRVLGIVVADLVIAAGLVLGALRPSIVIFTIGAFLVMSVLPVANSASQAIWQAKVDLDVQGRVFAIRRTIAQLAIPISYLAAGPIADGVLEPLMAEGGGLASTVGQFIGTGDGRGYALFFLILAGAAALTGVIALGYEPLRTLEETMPDVIPDPSQEVVPAEAPA